MTLLLDEGLPHPAVDALRERGFDAVHTRHVDLDSAEDERIVTEARANGWTVVTLDADFHAIIALSGERSPSVIRIRIEGLQWEPLATLITSVVRNHRDALEEGALVSVRERDVRVRRLPIRA